MKSFQFFLPLLFCFASVYVEVASSIGTSDGAEEWGYVEVRPGNLWCFLSFSLCLVSPTLLDLFDMELRWCRSTHVLVALQESSKSGQWLDSMANYPVAAGWTCKSLSLSMNCSECCKHYESMRWRRNLCAKQSASGVGIGNFQEIGPLDTNLKPRNSTWLQKADLLFVVIKLPCPSHPAPKQKGKLLHWNGKLRRIQWAQGSASWRRRVCWRRATGRRQKTWLRFWRSSTTGTHPCNRRTAPSSLWQSLTVAGSPWQPPCQLSTPSELENWSSSLEVKSFFIC